LNYCEIDEGEKEGDLGLPINMDNSKDYNSSTNNLVSEIIWVLFEKKH
jgi:hypothetical protein